MVAWVNINVHEETKKSVQALKQKWGLKSDNETILKMLEATNHDNSQ